MFETRAAGDVYPASQLPPFRPATGAILPSAPVVCGPSAVRPGADPHPRLLPRRWALEAPGAAAAAGRARSAAARPRVPRRTRAPPRSGCDQVEEHGPREVAGLAPVEAEAADGAVGTHGEPPLRHGRALAAGPAAAKGPPREACGAEPMRAQPRPAPRRAERISRRRAWAGRWCSRRSRGPSCARDPPASRASRVPRAACPSGPSSCCRSRAARCSRCPGRRGRRA